MALPSFKNLYAFLKNLATRLVTVGIGATGTLDPVIETSLIVVVPDAATSDIDVLVPTKFQVTGMTCIKRAGNGAGNTMQLKDTGGNAITAAVACDTDDAITSAATCVDTGGRNVFAAGSSVRLTATKAAGTRDALVLIRGFMTT